MSRASKGRPLGLPSLSENYLTKSAFLDYRACPGFAWLTRHRPELVPPSGSDALRRMREGAETERLARFRYPDGIQIAPGTMTEAVRETIARLKCPTTKVLFQATLVSEPGCLARADILIRDGDGWSLLEVKAVCEPRDEHVVDAAFQLATFEAAGLKITRLIILHLDREYRRAGAYDPQLLFTETDCTAEARAMLTDLRVEMALAATSLSDGERPASCDCHHKSRTNHCRTFSYFHPDVPERGSIYDLSRLNGKKLEAVVDRGIRALRDWPDDLPLSLAQQRQLDVHRAGKPWTDEAGLTAFLGQLAFPLYFLDYESSQTPLPHFDGCWPHQQVPFQYSLHIVAANSPPVHREFVSTDDQPPFAALAESLRQQIGPLGSVVVWNAGFERTRNRELADALPQHATFFHNLNERMVDLEHAVSKGHYVHPDFGGRSSLKVVLPVVAPDLSYEALTISDGATASDRWLACVRGEIDGPDRVATFAALREYCHLDTLAMVRIWQHLDQLRQSEPAVA